MPILEHIPSRKAIRTSLRTIQDTSVVTSDEDERAVRILWDRAQALWGLVRELEELRTKNLVEAYALGRSRYRQMAPPAELGPLQLALADPNRSKAEREELSETVRALCEAYAKGRKSFEDRLLLTVRLMRNKCLSLAESDLADRVIEVFNHKAEEMQREFIWAQESLKPLILDFQSQLASVDKAISDIASKNFFDRLLELMPSQSTINTLALPVSKGMPTSNGTTHIPALKAGTPPPLQTAAPAAPGAQATDTSTSSVGSQNVGATTGSQTEGSGTQTDQQAQTRTQTQQVVQETQTEESPKVVTVAVGTQTPEPTTITPPVQGDAPSGNGNTAKPPALPATPMNATNLSNATPEAVALKAAYEVMQNGLKLFSTGTNLYKLVTAHEKLQEQLNSVQKKHEAAMDRYHAIKQELDNLERVRVVLNSVAAYQCEVGACVTTLKAYTDAFATARAKPAVYYGLFCLLMDYLERLELVWQ